MAGLEGLKELLYKLYNKEYFEGLSKKEINNYLDSKDKEKRELLKELIDKGVLIKTKVEDENKCKVERYYLGPSGISLIESWENKKLSEISLFLVMLSIYLFIFSDSINLIRSLYEAFPFISILHIVFLAIYGIYLLKLLKDLMSSF